MHSSSQNKLIKKTMKQLFFAAALFSMSLFSCSSSQSLNKIVPKSGAIEIPAKGEFRIWKNIEHGAFTVTITNSSANQSVELYKVKSSGAEKWVSPSLLANSSLEVSIPADGHLFIKNFNDNVFTVTYKINE
jgi:hypothetical protein